MKRFLSIVVALVLMMSFMTVATTMANADAIVYDFEDGAMPSNFSGLYSPTLAVADGQGKDGSKALAYSSSAASRGLVITNLPSNAVGISFWAVATEAVSMNIRPVQAGSYTNVTPAKSQNISTTATEYTFDFSDAGVYVPRFLLQGGKGSNPTVYFDNITILCEGDIVEEETTTTTTTVAQGTTERTTVASHPTTTALPFSTNTTKKPFIHMTGNATASVTYGANTYFGEGVRVNQLGTGSNGADVQAAVYQGWQNVAGASIDNSADKAGSAGITFFVYIKEMYNSTVKGERGEAVTGTYNVSVKFYNENIVGTDPTKGVYGHTNIPVEIGKMTQVFIPWARLGSTNGYSKDFQITGIDIGLTNTTASTWKSADYTYSDIYLYTGDIVFADPATVSEAHAGGTAVAWVDNNGKFYGAGDTIAAPTTYLTCEVLAGDLATQTGAGVRWASTAQERGIRFETYVGKNMLDTLGSSNFTIGTLIAPAAQVTADNFKMENVEDLKALNVVDPKTYGTTQDGANYRYYGAVVDFEKYFDVSAEAASTLKLAARGYITVTYTDGETATFYSDFNALDHVRSVNDVANAALKDTAANYSAKQIEILELYCVTDEDTTVAYRTDAQDFVNND